MSRALDYLPAQWDLAVFCAALSHAQHSTLTMVAHSHGTRGLKLAALVILSWTVASVWTTVLVTLPQACSRNHNLVFSLVNKIHHMVHQYNRTRRVHDEPTWFEETYYDDNMTDVKTREETDNMTLSPTFPSVNMTLVPPTLQQCEGPALCLVVLLFVSYLLPILLISAINVRPRRHFEAHVEPWRPVPRPRSAPPCDMPRLAVQQPRPTLLISSENRKLKFSLKNCRYVCGAFCDLRSKL